MAFAGARAQERRAGPGVARRARGSHMYIPLRMRVAVAGHAGGLGGGAWEGAKRMAPGMCVCVCVSVCLCVES